MPKNSLNVSLKGADDIFSTEESRQEQQREQVQHKVERSRCVLAFNKLKADRPHGLPAGKVVGADLFILPFFRTVEIPVLMAVYDKSVVGTDRCFF